MSNSFPAPPSNWELGSVSYSAVLPAPTLQPGAALDFGAGVRSLLAYSVPILGVVFVFDVPGSFGTFDQAAVEGDFAQAVTAVCGVLASMSGAVLADLQSEVVITRTWSWTTGVSSVSTSDTMTYPSS
jgi:hypothetical protein